MTRPAHRQPGAWALVALGGAVGTAARYGFAQAWPTEAGRWPTATFAANLIGSFVLGVLLESLLLESQLPESQLPESPFVESTAHAGNDSGVRQRLRLLLGTGLCGGFTTYSTLAVEADLLVRDHHPALALGYVAATVVAGVVLAVVGIALAARVRR